MSIFGGERRLKGKGVLITGASMGIGLAAAEDFAREGARVVLAARHEELLRRACEDIRRSGGNADYIVLDVTDRKAVFAAVEEAEKRLGRLDVLVANAGVGHIGRFEDMSEADMRRVLGVNLTGLSFCVQACIPSFRRSGGGNIVIVSSILGKRAVPDYAFYSASKFAVQGLSEALRLELAPDNIRVSVVCPTRTRTAFFDNAGKSGQSRLPRSPQEMSARQVAAAILNAVRADRRETVLSFSANLMVLLNFICPRLLDRIVAAVMKK